MALARGMLQAVVPLAQSLAVRYFGARGKSDRLALPSMTHVSVLAQASRNTACVGEQCKMPRGFHVILTHGGYSIGSQCPRESIVPWLSWCMRSGVIARVLKSSIIDYENPIIVIDYDYEGL